MELDTPRTKVRKNVAEKRLSYLSRNTTPNELVTHRDSEDFSNVEVEKCDVVKSLDSTTTFTVESIQDRMKSLGCEYTGPVKEPVIFYGSKKLHFRF